MSSSAGCLEQVELARTVSGPPTTSTTWPRCRRAPAACTCARAPPPASAAAPAAPRAAAARPARHGWPASARLLVGVRADRRGGDHRVRPLRARRRAERRRGTAPAPAACSRAEVVREGERQAERAGELRAVAAGAQQPHVRHVPSPGRRDGRERVAVGPRARRRSPAARRAARGNSSAPGPRCAAAPAPSPGRCPARGRCRGRCGPGAAPPASRTAPRPPAADGSAASPRRSRPACVDVAVGEVRRSARPATSSRCPACCGARPPRGGGSRAVRRGAELEAGAQRLARQRLRGSPRNKVQALKDQRHHLRSSQPVSRLSDQPAKSNTIVPETVPVDAGVALARYLVSICSKSPGVLRR